MRAKERWAKDPPLSRLRWENPCADRNPMTGLRSPSSTTKLGMMKLGIAKPHWPPKPGSLKRRTTHCQAGARYSSCLAPPASFADSPQMVSPERYWKLRELGPAILRRNPKEQVAFPEAWGEVRDSLPSLPRSRSMRQAPTSQPWMFPVPLFSLPVQSARVPDQAWTAAASQMEVALSDRLAPVAPLERMKLRKLELRFVPAPLT